MANNTCFKYKVTLTPEQAAYAHKIGKEREASHPNHYAEHETMSNDRDTTGAFCEIATCLLYEIDYQETVTSDGARPYDILDCFAGPIDVKGSKDYGYPFQKMLVVTTQLEKADKFIAAVWHGDNTVTVHGWKSHSEILSLNRLEPGKGDWMNYVVLETELHDMATLELNMRQPKVPAMENEKPLTNDDEEPPQTSPHAAIAPTKLGNSLVYKCPSCPCFFFSEDDLLTHLNTFTAKNHAKAFKIFHEKIDEYSGDQEFTVKDAIQKAADGSWRKGKYNDWIMPVDHADAAFYVKLCKQSGKTWTEQGNYEYKVSGNWVVKRKKQG